MGCATSAEEKRAQKVSLTAYRSNIFGLKDWNRIQEMDSNKNINCNIP